MAKMKKQKTGKQTTFSGTMKKRNVAKLQTPGRHMDDGNSKGGNAADKALGMLRGK